MDGGFCFFGREICAVWVIGIGKVSKLLYAKRSSLNTRLFRNCSRNIWEG